MPLNKETKSNQTTIEISDRFKRGIEFVRVDLQSYARWVALFCATSKN